MSSEIFDSLPQNIKRKFKPVSSKISFTSISNEKLSVLGTLELNFKLPNVKDFFSANFYIIRNISKPFVLGCEFLSDYDIKIFAKQNIMYYKNHPIPFLSSHTSSFILHSSKSVYIPAHSMKKFLYLSQDILVTNNTALLLLYQSLLFYLQSMRV